MPEQVPRIVSAEESGVHDEPHLGGHRITVRQIVERVEGRGLNPRTVADRYDLPLSDVYRALTYYHDNPEEMERVTQRKLERERAALDRGVPTLARDRERREE